MAPNVTPAMLRQQSVGGTYVSGGTLEQLSEHVPELRWPASTNVYDVMRKDGKCASVLRAMTMPVRGTSWHVVDSPDVRPEVAQFVRNNLGLIEEGDTRRRRRGQGLSWDTVLRHALLMLPFGHMFFEPVYQVGPAGPNDLLPPGQYAHLSRLAPILPPTIAGFQLDPAGDLLSITQAATGEGGRWVEILLPRELILPVINDREGSDWSGQSMLRAAYKHWFLKDKLERLAVMIAERNGMGVPTAEFGADMDRIQIERALTAFRAGEMAAVAFPAGSNFRLAGVDGTLSDPMPQIAYHGQEIARSVLAMFLDLGHDNGARSLGETFVDFFTIAINAVISDLEETFTEGLSRRLVELNFGPDEGYPEINADEITPQAPLTADTIAQLVTAGALHPDDALEGFVRHTFGMPPATPADADAPPPDAPTDTIAIQTGGGAKMSGTVAERLSRLDRMRARIGPRRR